MKVGARNQLVGTVTEVKKGSVMAQVKLTIPAGSQMASVMTVDSLGGERSLDGTLTPRPSTAAGRTRA
jgi:molybdopterin-binding protein